MPGPIKLKVSQAWKPENGREYGIVEITIAPDFQIGPDMDMWGVVNCRDLDLVTSFEKLRIVGDPEWCDRFTWQNMDRFHTPPINYPWQQALGGMSGATALSGIHSINSKLRIRQLEIIGVPGSGIYYINSPGGYPIVESMFCDRVGWPIMSNFQNWGGASFRNVTTRDHWFASKEAWGAQAQERARSMRRLEASKGLMGRGEVAMTEAGWQLINFTHSGDGCGFKVAGTDYTIRGYQGGRSMFNGVVPDNLKAPYEDPVKWRHLHVAENITAEDGYIRSSRFLSPYAPLLYFSFPFTEPLKLKRWVFENPWSQPSNYATGERFACGQNWAAVEYEDCDFIGWPDQQAAINLSPELNHATWGLLPAATAKVTGCRFWAS